MIKNRFVFTKKSETEYTATDALERKDYVFGDVLAEFAMKLDGKTDPYSIEGISKSDCSQMLETLDEGDFLRRSRVFQKTLIAVRLSLWFPKPSAFLRAVARVFNTLLMLLWIPAPIIGIYLFLNDMQLLEGGSFTLGFVLGIVAGLFFHELSHAFAALSYGAHVFEFGISVGLLPGAYVLSDMRMLKKPARQLQCLAAGVEMNMLLGGILIAASALIPELNLLLFSAGYVNIFMGIINLTAVVGLDGMQIIDVLLGQENFVFTAYDIVTSRRRRKKLMRSATGQVIVASSFIMMISQLALPLLLLANLVEVVSWFR